MSSSSSRMSWDIRTRSVVVAVVVLSPWLLALLPGHCTSGVLSAAGEYRGSGWGVEGGGEPTGVEATDVHSTKASPWTRLVVGAGASGGLPRLLLWSVDCLGKGADWTDLSWLLWL